MISAQDLLSVLFVASVVVGLPTRLLGHGTRPTGTMLLLAGQAGLLLTILPEPLADRPLAVAVGGAAAVVAVALVARLAGRVSRWWLLVAAVAAMPIRIPLPVGNETYNLLVPLYGVLAVAALRLLMDDVAEQRAERASSPAPGGTGEWAGARMLDIAVSAFFGYASLSAFWALDLPAARERVALAFAPFVILYVLVRAWHADTRWLRPAFLVFVASMAVAALVGIYQHEAQVIWQNPKVEVANTYAPDFRTNSLFWDPNIYGRYLVLALIALVVALATMRLRSRGAAGFGAAGALLLTGLWWTYSQSSFAALAAAFIVLAILSSRRITRYAMVGIVIATLISAPLLARGLDGKDQQSRSKVAQQGFVIAAATPINGVGLASFPEAVTLLAQERGERRPRLRESHATPVTVFAELGVFGVALYLLLLTTAGGCAVAHTARVRNAALGLDSRGGAPALAVARARWWAAAALAALVTHSMFYAGFFEDPAMWLALALLAGTASATPGADALSGSRA
jgi:putative inorganic carbon (hco3(-)) transporter